MQFTGIVVVVVVVFKGVYFFCHFFSVLHIVKCLYLVSGFCKADRTKLLPSPYY